MSDNYFSILSPALNQTITVTSPNGGETWEKGSYSTVNWSSENVSSQLDIQLYKSNNLVYTLASTPNDGYQDIYVSDNWVESGSYKIKIRLSSDNSIYDFSDNYFTINEPLQSCFGDLIIAAPNGCLNNSNYFWFSWSGCNHCPAVTLEYGTTASMGSFIDLSSSNYCSEFNIYGFGSNETYYFCFTIQK